VEADEGGGEQMMTRDELMALKRPCPKCNGSGQTWSRVNVITVESCECPTCLGTGYVLPATEEVLALVDTADFWRAVALNAAEATDYDYPMNWDAEQRLAAIADEVRAERRKAKEADTCDGKTSRA
jgi:hypothetical protein